MDKCDINLVFKNGYLRFFKNEEKEYGVFYDGMQFFVAHKQYRNWRDGQVRTYYDSDVEGKRQLMTRVYKDRCVYGVINDTQYKAFVRRLLNKDSYKVDGKFKRQECKVQLR